jgi:hypothetical protein
MRFLVASPLVLLVASMVVASPAAQQQPQRGPDNTPTTIVNGIDVLALPGMPFSAIDKIVWTRTLEGAGSSVLTFQAKVARDSQGRLYRERHHFGPANADPESTLFEFFVIDPTTRTRTDCVLAQHLCHIVNYMPQLRTFERPVGPFDQGRQYLTRESLGTQYIGNLSVSGTLETVVIAPGTIGNDQPITTSREFWYSPDLKTNLAVTRKDPRTGTQAITLVNFSRNEPDESVFTVPAGYRVQDDRRGARPLPNTPAAPVN